MNEYFGNVWVGLGCQRRQWTRSQMLRNSRVNQWDGQREQQCEFTVS